jgi:hypothetical protein
LAAGSRPAGSYYAFFPMGIFHIEFWKKGHSQGLREPVRVSCSSAAKGMKNNEKVTGNSAKYFILSR